jgi:hypothetical protein
MARALVNYRTTLGIARLQNGMKVRAPDDVVQAARARFGHIVDETRARQIALLGDLGGERALLQAAAAEVGRELEGVPLTRSQIRSLAELALAAAPVPDSQGGRRPVLELGDAFLPGEPHIGLALAELEASVDPTQAGRRLEGVLARQAALDDEARRRADALRDRLVGP